MSTIEKRIMDGATEGLITIPLSAAGGYLCGYVYAKWTNLPPAQVAKYFTIWAVASGAIMILITKLTEHMRLNSLLAAALTTVSATVAIKTMRREGLMGNKMLTVFLIVNFISVVGFLSAAAGKGIE